MNFDNIKRNRYYGLRKGDIVKCPAYDIETAVVVNYGVLDNNAVYVLVGWQKRIKVPAEWCEIIAKVEDININKNGKTN
jgi:hypothetical protein